MGFDAVLLNMLYCALLLLLLLVLFRREVK